MTTPSSGVVALVISRGLTPTLPATLDALARQTFPPDAVVVIDAGGPPLDAAEMPAGALLVHVPGARTLGDAIRRAATTAEAGPVLSATRRWWILHDDSAPEPTCLAELWEVADRGRTVAVVGPKQVSWDASILLEVGIAATRSGRRLEMIVPGEIDQGQYDGTSDVLAVGSAGMLVERQVWEELGGTDPALGPFGDGLEFCRRVRRAGHRIVLAPRARLRHARSSLSPHALVPPDEDARADQARDTGTTGEPEEVADPPEDTPAQGSEPEPEEVTTPEPVLVDLSPREPRSTRAVRPSDSSFRARRFAQLYNWNVAVPWWQWPLLVVWLIVWTPARALGRILTGRAHLASDELAAWGRLVLATPSVFRSRHRAARSATLPRSVLAPLEVTPRSILAQRRLVRRIHQTQRSTLGDPLVLGSLRRHTTSSRTALLGVLAFLLLASLIPGAKLLGDATGAAWASAPSTWTDLWQAAWSGWLPGSDGSTGPGDPVTVVLALLCAPFALLGVAPTTVATWILVLAPLLAGLAAGPLASHLTTSVPARTAATLAWAALPALTVSALQGRLAAVLVHLLLPLLALGWLRVLTPAAPLVVEGATTPVALRVPGRRGAGWAALALAGIVAAAPWMLALAILVLLILLAAVPRARHRVGVLAATLLPAALLVAPFAVRAARTHTWVGLLSPGGPALATRPPSSWMLLLGMPAGTGSLWVACFGGIAAILILATLVSLWRNPASAGLPALVGLLGLASALALTRIDVAASDSVATAWPAPALSASGLGFLLAALCATRSGRAWDSEALRVLRTPALVVSLLAVLGVGTLCTARLVADADRPFDRVTTTQTSAVAAVSAQAQSSDRAGRVLVLRGGVDGLDVTVLRGDGTLLTDASALTRAAHLHELLEGSQDTATADLAARALALVTSPDAATVEALAAHDIDTVLIPDTSAPGMADMVEALDRAPGVERVGTTDAGELWRIRPDAGQPARARLVSGGSWSVVASEFLGIDTTLPQGSTGTLVLAERADPGWHATLDGHTLEAADPGDGWAQTFTVTGGGELRVSYSPWWLWPWRVCAGLGLLVAAGATIPSRRHP